MKFKLQTAALGFLWAATSAVAQPSAATAAPPAESPAVAHAGFLKMVRGDVQLLSAGGVLRPGRVGDEVAPIERIVTGRDSAASLVLRDGSTLVVGPSSRLDLKEFSFDSTTRDGNMLVSLVRGSLRMITGLIGKTQPDAVRIETQTATIGIRGTDFIVQADAQQ